MQNSRAMGFRVRVVRNIAKRFLMGRAARPHEVHLLALRDPWRLAFEMRGPPHVRALDRRCGTARHRLRYLFPFANPIADKRGRP
jgi:hypothetical protein